jgi:glycerol-1-phosphate dehydrogenase [NAD(P)+]
VELPQIFIFESDAGEEEAAKELTRFVEDLGIESPMVLSSTHGERLSSHLSGPEPSMAPHKGADQEWAGELGSRAQRAGADAIVAVGGGRCLDIGKLAAARAGLTVITVPTQLSHDGICSPVAVVPNDDGRPESVGAIAPRAVFISPPTITTAPADSLRAGLGDLLANPLALRDWTLAADRDLDKIDQKAWDLSVESFDVVEPFLDRDPADSAGDTDFLRSIANGLVLSGLAMISSGTSRPASGGEHEISHAIDDIYGGRALHGAQVAFGCIVSVALYGEDFAGFRARLNRLKLPSHPADLGMDEDEVVRVLLEAPETRPGRFTIIEASDLDEAKARSLVRLIWAEG